MRHVPFGVDRIAREAAAEMIVDAALAHGGQHVAHGVVEVGAAGATPLLPEETEDRRVREFRRVADAAKSAVDLSEQRAGK